MVEEQAVFEQLTWSKFKIWSSTPLKTVNNYSIRIAKNTDNVVLLSLLLISEFIQQTIQVNFMLLNILK